MAERKKVKKVNLHKQKANKHKTIYNNVPSRKKSKSFKTEDIVMESAELKRPVRNKAKQPPRTAYKNQTEVYRKSTPDKSKTKKSKSINWRIIGGTKLKARRNRYVTLFVVFPLILALMLFIFLTPTGPIEAVTNAFAKIGGGTFPKSVVGSKLVSLKSEGNTAFLLTNTHISGYTSSGKELFEYQHNFSSPVLKTSSTRSLVFNRQGTGYIVLNSSSAVYNKEYSKPIYCGDIADDGTIAFATKSDKYSAQVDVFGKNLKHKFSWFSVDGLISDMALSNDGNYIAIAVLKAKDGTYLSEIHLFNINSDKELYSIAVEGSPIYGLENISSRYFSYTTDSAVTFSKWTEKEEKKIEKLGLSPSFYKNTGNLNVVVFGKNTSSNISIIKNTGEEAGNFSYNGLIDDISVTDKNVYILKGNKIFILDFTGKTIDTVSTEQTPYAIASSKNGVFAAENVNLLYFERG